MTTFTFFETLLTAKKEKFWLVFGKLRIPLIFRQIRSAGDGQLYDYFFHKVCCTNALLFVKKFFTYSKRFERSTTIEVRKIRKVLSTKLTAMTVMAYK